MKLHPDEKRFALLVLAVTALLVLAGCATKSAPGPSINIEPARIASTQAAQHVDNADSHLDRALKALGQ